MYGHFIQFTIPKIGQALVAVVLYLNFLKLPFVACFAGVYPAVYLLLPLLLLAVMSWIGRDPLGPGMIVNSHLTGLYIAGDVVGLLARAIGGTVLTVWQTIWMGGLLAWVGTAAMMLWSYFKAMRLVTTTYRLQTTKPLPGGKLRVLQISDLHPGKGAVDRKRIPELNRRIRELNPDMILFTGDIFDEHVERPDFDSFNAFFATLDPPGGKWFVLGNHDLFHHWREPSYGRADLEGAFARAHIRILEDVSQLAYVEVSGKHLYFNLTDGQVREVVGSLKDYEPLLLARPEFMRIHRSYIVNMLQIDELSPAGVHTFSGANLPVSRLLYPQLQKDYMKLLFAKRDDA